MARLPGGSSPKVLVVGAVLVALAGVAAVSLLQVLQLRPQLGEKQRLIETLTAQNQQLQQELASLQTGRQDLEARLKDVRKELLSSTTELGRLRDSAAEVQKRYDGLASEKVQMETRVTELTRERDAAQAQVHRLEEDKGNLERASGRLRNRFDLLDRDYQRLAQRLEVMEQKGTIAAPVPGASGAKPAAPQSSASPATSQVSAPGTTPMAATSAPPALNASQTIELPPIVVHKDQTAAAKLVQATVVEVNEAQRFVVVDKGSQDGLLMDMVLDVVRGAARIGRVRVVRVRPQMSACDIILPDTAGALQVGDKVVQQH